VTVTAPPARTGRTPAVRPVRRRRASHAGTGWLFVSPFLAVFALFTLVPVVMAVGLSLTDIRVADLRTPFAVGLTGLDNYETVLGNAAFRRALLNTAVYVVIGVPVTMAIGFVLALALDSGIRRMRNTFRAIFYVPVIANVVAAAVLWQYAFTPNGPVNEALSGLGITGPNWLNEPAWAVTTVLLLTIWRNIGTCMVLFLAGLQSVPEEVHEAAALDGAGYWRRVFSMTIPMVKPTTLLVSVLMSVNFLNIFEEPYLVTRGGPLGSTESIASWVNEQFGFGNISGSLAGSMVLLVVVVVVSAVQMRVLRSDR